MWAGISTCARDAIHEDCVIPPTEEPPPGSRFKGYRDFVVQDLKIEAHNTRYRLEVWQTPDGEWLRGELPATLQGGHFGPSLRAYLLYQHHHCHVTQALLREQLLEWGIDLSVGQIDALLSGHNEPFFAEKDQRLEVGLEVSSVITVDDSGARHQGRNGYVTQIGNDFFAWFSSTESTSRINFLELLQAGEPVYGLNDEALMYWREQGLPQALRQALAASPILEIATTAAWEEHLKALGITKERHRRIATEGALLGGLLEKGLSRELVIVSDGAGQFAILLHALCWVHAERLIHKLIPLNERQRLDQERVRDEIWTLYADLKAYQRAPDPAAVADLHARFEALFSQKTSFATLNQILKRLKTHQSELLLVLLRPDIPLHTNGSENDIRGYVKWRKISGGTRSDLGRRYPELLRPLQARAVLPSTAGERPAAIDWRRVTIWAKVIPGRIFGHLRLPWLSLHFQGYESLKILPTSTTPMAELGTRSWADLRSRPTDPLGLHHRNNPFDVILRFLEGWNTTIAFHGPFTRIITGKSQHHVALEAIQQPAQIRHLDFGHFPDRPTGLWSVVNHS
jgi:hypothetical protein